MRLSTSQRRLPSSWRVSARYPASSATASARDVGSTSTYVTAWTLPSIAGGAGAWGRASCIAPTATSAPPSTSPPSSALITSYRVRWYW